MKWTSVSSKYLSKSATAEEKLSWIHFLEKLGVKKYLVVEKVNVPVPKVHNYCKDLVIMLRSFSNCTIRFEEYPRGWLYFT